MKTFDIDKQYIFDIEIALNKDKVLARYYKNNALTREWVKECQGKKVKVLNSNNGRIQGNKIEYSIMPEWCKEVK